MSRILTHRLFLLSLLLTPACALAQATDPLLFDSNTVLELTMPVNFDTLCRPSTNPDCDYAATVFEYRDSAGNEQSLPIGILRRDGWRATKTNCQVPTLFVRFDDEYTQGTPFEGQSSLALTSHCGKGISRENIRSRRLPDKFESYVVNEYLGYRLYGMITDASLRVRLVRIHYTNPDNPKRDFTHYAFFAEHVQTLANRLGAELLPAQSFDPDWLDLHAADKMALFHYMVGNTDWSIENQDNVFLIRDANGKQVPVMYDLDMSGLVDAFYARPLARLPIQTVKQRYYLGYCHPDTFWEALFAEFTALRENFMALIDETPGLGRGDRRMAGAYIDSFFSILESERAREIGIMNTCQPWPPVIADAR